VARLPEMPGLSPSNTAGWWPFAGSLACAPADFQQLAAIGFLAPAADRPYIRLDMATSMTTIDVFSDVVCPWCYLGKRRLERALDGLSPRKAAITWRAFRLDPTIPPEGIDRDAYI